MIFFGIRDFFLHPEMSPSCAHLLPSDGDSTDDYCGRITVASVVKTSRERKDSFDMIGKLPCVVVV